MASDSGERWCHYLPCCRVSSGLVKEWEGEERGHRAGGSEVEQRLVKRGTAALLWGKGGMELCVPMEELQPWSLLLSQQDEKAVRSGLSTQFRAI